MSWIKIPRIRNRRKEMLEEARKQTELLAKILEKLEQAERDTQTTNKHLELLSSTTRRSKGGRRIANYDYE